MPQQITAIRPPSDDDAALLRSWRRSLAARDLSPHTVEQYLRSAGYLAAHLGGTPLTAVTKADAEGFLVATIERTSAATAAVRYRCLKQLYRWLLAEGEVAVDPFAGLREPKGDDTLPAVLSVAEITAVIAACDTRGLPPGDVRAFEAVRDEAVLRLFADTGVRASGMVQQTLATADVDARTLTVLEKRKERVVPFGVKTAAALDRYLRHRRRRPSAAGTDALWLSRYGPMTYSGIRQAVRKRGAMAGVPALHPHTFRHSAAHHLKVAGVQNDDLKVLFGWTSDAMVSLYGRSAARERAILAHRAHGLGDKL